ncbi:MAG: hypothetical protein R2710_13260 [Acidimicrobiales bacterium]
MEANDRLVGDLAELGGFRCADDGDRLLLHAASPVLLLSPVVSLVSVAPDAGRNRGRVAACLPSELTKRGVRGLERHIEDERLLGLVAVDDVGHQSGALGQFDHGDGHRTVEPRAGTLIDHVAVQGCLA